MYREVPRRAATAWQKSWNQTMGEKEKQKEEGWKIKAKKEKKKKLDLNNTAGSK